MAKFSGRQILRVESIRPNKMNIRQYRRAVERALELESRTIEGLYRGVSDGFDTPVQYAKTKLRRGSEFGIRVATKDIRMISLDEGTKVRWAVMSSDFRPKTIPGRLTSRAGSGKTVIRGKNAMRSRNIRPRPGIKARGFSKEIVKQRENQFPTRVQRAIDQAAQKTY